MNIFIDRPGLRNVDEIKRLNQAVLQTLQRELIQRPPPSAIQPGRTDVSILTKLLNKRHSLRYISSRPYSRCYLSIKYTSFSPTIIIIMFSLNFKSPCYSCREISYMHMECLNKLRSNTIGTLAFPELHNELFPAT